MDTCVDFDCTFHAGIETRVGSIYTPQIGVPSVEVGWRRLLLILIGLTSQKIKQKA